MIGFDPSLWLLLAVPFLAAAIYVSWRGCARNEFRVRGEWPWKKYRTGSIDWYLSTLVNLTFVGAGFFMVYESTFRGTDFSREPELAMPALTGDLVDTIRVGSPPDALARCLADANHGKIFAPNDGTRRVAVVNGRNDVMYIFDIVPQGDVSLMKVYRLSSSPFVGWAGCVRRA